MIKSVIDIGTNTAHLLIGDVTNKTLVRSILKHREYTYLGEKGLLKIHSEPLDRLYKALRLFDKYIINHASQPPIIIATDALRSASNGPEIQKEITNILKVRPIIISGSTEAKLIRKGVELSLNAVPNNYLIMDIGGGSVEFIHVAGGTQVLLKSIPLGISRLYERCNEADVMSAEIVSDLKNHIKKVAEAVIESSRLYADDLMLIGSAGTFEIFLPEGHLEDPTIAHSIVDLRLIKERYEQILYMERGDRKRVSWLPNVRNKYIVVALLLMQTIIEEINPKRLLVSKYALKEGAMVTDFNTIQSNF